MQWASAAVSGRVATVPAARLRDAPLAPIPTFPQRGKGQNRQTGQHEIAIAKVLPKYCHGIAAGLAQG